MNPNELRIKTLRGFLAQVGKKLSKASKDKVKECIDKLAELIAEDGDEEEVEQAFDSSQAVLCQGLVTGISTADTYEALCGKLSRAVRGNKELPGDYRYTFFTHAEWVAFEAYSYETYDLVGYYIADYADDGATITFSNVRDASIETIIRVIADGEQTVAMKKLCDGSEVSGCSMLGPVILQSVRNGVICQKQTDGRYIIQGIATHGNVVNRSNPPIVFPTVLWAGELAAMQDLIAQGKAVGCLGHPSTEDGDYREPTEAEFAMRFTSLEQSGDFFVFEAVTCTSQAGKDFAALIDDGVAFDMSTVARAKTKKQDWMGQQVHVAQPDNFQWVRIADAVLQGASPGAEITDVRLQALNMGPNKEDGQMTPEEIMALIQKAIAEKNDDAVIALQAELKKLTDSLETKQTTLSDDDKALLQKAGEIVARDDAKAIAQARDAKVESVVAGLVKEGDDQKLAPMFRQSAITMLSAMCQGLTADDVEGKTSDLLESMKPLIQNQSILESKGMYTPEYQRNGDSKIVVNTPREAVEDMVQTAIKQGRIKDTGSNDPDNMAHNARVMLQTLANERPAYAVSYMRLRNGDAVSPADNVAFLEQNYRHLVQEIPTGAMTTTDVATAIPYVLPIVLEILPQLIAGRYASMQPMSRSVGTIAYWKIYGQDAENADFQLDVRDAFDGSYAVDPGQKQTVKKIKGKLETENITPTAKKLAYDLSVEVIRRLRTDWGIDASAVMIQAMAEEIAREWNYNHLATMWAGATATAVNYGTAKPADSSFDGEQWQKQIIPHLFKARSNIRKKTSAATVSFIGDDDSIMRIAWLAKEVGAMNKDGSGQGRIASGVNIVGSLSDGGELVAVDWWDTLQPNSILAIGRGNQWYQTGYVVAPYLGLYITPQTVDADTFDVEQGMMSESADKVVNGDFMCQINIQVGTAGTPL